MRTIFPIIILRAGWGGFASYHFTHLHIPDLYQNTVLALFVLYQVMKLTYYFKSNEYDQSAKEKLHVINISFLILIVISCLSELFKEIAESKLVSEIPDHVMACIFKIILYVIIEYMMDFWYCKKIEKLNGKQEASNIQTLGKSLKSFFGFGEKDNGSKSDKKQGRKPPQK